MFVEIKQLKERSLNKSQISRYLNIDFKTVSKYWNMILTSGNEKSLIQMNFVLYTLK